MGCDIHLAVEVKFNNQWHHYNIADISRNYDLFARMAGVRSSYDASPKPIAKPRGLPKDVSVMTKFMSDYWDGDGHSHSWLSSKECYKLLKEFPWLEESTDPRDWRPQVGYLFGNHFTSWREYKEDRPKGIQDWRFVFWFDN